jgi:hypothetical protein
MAGITEEELESSVSTVSMNGYRRAPKSDQPKILEWVAGLRQMPDRDFVAECASKILDSAIMNRFPRINGWGTHARADICADEADRRHQLAGHDADCRGATLYSEGYNAARRSQGHPAEPLNPCTCGLKGEETS